MKRKPLVTIIKRSCLTGKAVWIYQGASNEAAQLSYWRACKREIHRVRYLWGLMVARRGKNIARLLEVCTAGLPPVSELTQEQKSAIKTLRLIASQNTTCQSDLYNHIMEERRIRKQDAAIRRGMRE